METKDEGPEVTDVDDRILHDLASRYATLRCPVHDVPPEFEVATDGSVIERFCCEALSQIFRELQASETAEQAGEDAGRREAELAPLLAGQGAQTLGREDEPG